MLTINVQDVGFSWPASQLILRPFSLHLAAGFYGLVGANGAGKTTFLSLLAGHHAPSQGAITFTPSNAMVTYCAQTLETYDDEIESFSHRYDREAILIRSDFGLDELSFYAWDTLSPGQRRRWQIAAALAQRPDVLLLDEPTNHLDPSARDTLITQLTRFQGICVIVSHDRAFLDAVTHHTLRVHQQNLTLWPGGYSSAKALWTHERGQQLDTHAAARKQLRIAKQQLIKAQDRQAAAAANTSTGRRMKNRHDSDARGLMATSSAARAVFKTGQTTSNARTQLARATHAVPHVERDRTQGRSIHAAFQKAPNERLFHLEASEICREDQVILRDVQMTVHREDRLRIVGANGAGKTTFLEALIASFPHPERMLYLPQEVSHEQTTQLLERLYALNSDDRGQIFSIFAALGSDPERILRSDATRLSPGEIRKLLLAEAFSKHVWALVLDEPTNHMDLPSVERLEDALSNYPGAILLVTHDNTFAENTTTTVLTIKSGMIETS